MGIAFSLAENDDWLLNGSGNLEQVLGTDKLKRDLIKFFKTDRKGNYGQELEDSIGSKIKSTQSILTEVKRKVIDTLQRFVDWQEEDLTVDDAERLEASQVFTYPDLEDMTRVTFSMQLYNAYRENLGATTFSITT